MKITPEIMKKYHVDKITITRGIEYPQKPLDWSPYEAIVVDVTGQGLHLRMPVDINLCDMASILYSISPVQFALIETMRGFADYVEKLMDG